MVAYGAFNFEGPRSRLGAAIFSCSLNAALVEPYRLLSQHKSTFAVLHPSVRSPSVMAVAAPSINLTTVTVTTPRATTTTITSSNGGNSVSNRTAVSGSGMSSTSMAISLAQAATRAELYQRFEAHRTDLLVSCQPAVVTKHFGLELHNSLHLFHDCRTGWHNSLNIDLING
jgi:hypothetical protein